MTDRVPEYSPDDAEAQRIAEEFADAADELAYLEGLADEQRDRLSELTFEQRYGPFGTS